MKLVYTNIYDQNDVLKVHPHRYRGTLSLDGVPSVEFLYLEFSQHNSRHTAGHCKTMQMFGTNTFYSATDTRLRYSDSEGNKKIKNRQVSSTWTNTLTP